ncbi:MAG TPA: transglutaminase-like domain-containing protein [Chloroflexota bacterium]|nr:transglutaminase-like domain-containing protein [Chloroflexota bacterium]
MDESILRVRTTFAAMVNRPSSSIPLAETCLLIAAEEYPQLDVGSYLSRIDSLADGIRERVDNAEDARAAGTALARFLHHEEGFRGDEEDYYDPRNSFLNEVMDRKRGIPVTLSILYIEIARRLGLPVSGVGLPGHFLVRLSDAGTFVDPFTGQVDLQEADCAERVRAIHGGRLKFERNMLTALSNRQILVRVLRNLREIYRERADTHRQLAALDRIVLLHPQDHHARRDRAAVLEQLGEYQRALRDIEQVRRLQPSLRRSERFRAWRRYLREMAARMN